MVTVFFWESPPQILTPKHKATEDKALIPYAIIIDAHTQHFDDKGVLSYQFTSQKLQHFRVNLSEISPGDYTTLDAPKLTLYTQDGPWFITAELGKATDNGNTLTLWNNVQIWQSNDGNKQTTELKTDQLIIEPLNKTVKTASKVNITSAQGQLESIGMNINLNTKRIELLNKVRGHHEPI